MKTCTKCGNETENSMNYCPVCGASLTAQPDETLTGEIIATDNMSEQNSAPTAKKIRKFNVGHLGVVLSSLLAIVAMFIPNLAAQGNIIALLTTNSVSLVVEGSDGRTYALILIALLLATLAMTYFRKNMLTIIGSIASLAWILYMYINCEHSIFRGLGLLLFPVSGVLLVVFAIIACKIARNQQA